MSCVIGLVTDGGVLLGEDSAANDGNVIITNTFSKLVVVKLESGQSIGFGCTGSISLAPAIRYHTEAPKFEGPYFSPTKYVLQALIPALRKGFEAACYEPEPGSEFLVGIMDRLFLVDSDYGVTESSSGYDAVGIGREFALGSLWTTGKLIMQPLDRMHAALGAASQLSPYVREPFHTEHIDMWRK